MPRGWITRRARSPSLDAREARRAACDESRQRASRIAICTRFVKRSRASSCVPLVMVVMLLMLVILPGCHPPERAHPAPPPSPPVETATVAAHEIVMGERRPRRVVDDLRDEEEPSPETVAYEREQYRRVLTRQIASILRRIEQLEVAVEEASADVKPAKQRDLDEARGWWRLLEQDVSAVERARTGGGHAWLLLKLRIARHLEDERPASFPSWADRSYGI